MSTTAATSKSAKGLSMTVIILGALMFVLGCALYAVVSMELSSQGITVAAVSKDDPGSLAGNSVNDPFSALAEINAIQAHLDNTTGGKTYGELGNVATSDGATYNADVTAANSTDGQTHSAGDPLSAADKATYQQRNTAQTAAFLQSSLFLSVLAFGVSAFIAVIGIVIGLVGINLRVLAKRLSPAQAVPHAEAA